MRKDKRINMQDLIEEAARYDQALSQKEKSILSAAEGLFAEKGASDTPTAEIARKAGVTERTLFRYFPSKDDLLKRVMFPVLLKVVVPIQINKLKVLLKNSDTGIAEMFKNIFRDRLNMASENKGKIRFILGEILKNEALRDQVVKLWEKELWAEAVQAVESLQKSGQIRSNLKSATVARTMLSIIMAYVLAKHVMGSNPKWNDEDEIAEIFDVLMNGIGPR
ncbi:MAG: TetR/AcrR family transcriptional regulator [Bdellovibrionales bacterium]|nr:TetR/AcrR family transcriptional regulator [Bdellovibrionales bacterium]